VAQSAKPRQDSAMRARSSLAILLALGLTAWAAEDDLPKQGKTEAVEAGAPLFRNEAGGDMIPGTNVPDFELLPADPPEPVLDVERAKADYERAQRKQVRWQKLVKAGVLAQVEAENAVVQTAKARVKYEKARVAEQQRALEELREKVKAGQAAVDAVTSAESALATARAMSGEAEQALKQTLLLYAESNVDRQRRLIAMGSGSRSQLRRAEDNLSLLKAPAPEVQNLGTTKVAK
jgi:multidrug resistance efflux pump